jgi:chromosome segregation ATPase
VLGEKPHRALFGEMMTRSTMIALLIAVSLGGCASPCQLVRSTEEVEANIDTIRSRKNALELEVKSLRDLNEKLTANADSLIEGLQREKRGLEQIGDSSAIKEPQQNAMEQKIKDLTAQKRVLQNEYEELKSQNKTLRATVTRYQKDIKELQHIPSFTDLDLDRISHGEKLRHPATLSSASSD